MSQVGVQHAASPTDLLKPDTASKPSNQQKKPKAQQQSQKGTQQQSKGHGNPKAGGKGPKAPKPKGGKAAPQPYYQELIMQLTNAPEWRQCQSEAVQNEALKSNAAALPMVTVTTTTTTTTTTQATLQVPKEVRPEPKRQPSSRSIQSFQSARSYQSAQSAPSYDPSVASESTLNDSEITLSPLPPKKARRTAIRKFPKASGSVLSLSDMHTTSSLHALLERYGGVQHGGILDQHYSFFVNEACTAAISFIVKDKIAVVGGDPLCPPSLLDSVFAEFAAYRKKHGLGITVFGGSDALLEYGKAKGWSSIRFGQERVLNPLTNPVLHGKVQKQIIKYNKALLDPARGGNTVNIYDPATNGRDLPLENSLQGVYDSWKEAKNASGAPQRYTTIYDPFALPDLMIYIYTRDRSGTPNGFAALRKMGARGGYYIDPCIAAPGAPTRIPDLLYFTAMGLLNMLGCNYLAIGMEPADELELHGFPRKFSELAKRAHKGMYASLKLQGKKEYHSKFRPDDSLGSGLHLMFPGGAPGPRRILSVVHFANISLREVVKERWEKRQTKKQADKLAQRDAADGEAKESSESEGSTEGES